MEHMEGRIGNVIVDGLDEKILQLSKAIVKEPLKSHIALLSIRCYCLMLRMFWLQKSIIVQV